MLGKIKKIRADLSESGVKSRTNPTFYIVFYFNIFTQRPYGLGNPLPTNYELTRPCGLIM
jgi:hypothetical protein